MRQDPSQPEGSLAHLLRAVIEGKDREAALRILFEKYGTKRLVIGGVEYRHPDEKEK